MEILSEKEKEALFKKLNIGPEDLPKINSSDPEAEALGAKAGDVLKIKRTDATATYFHYRIVV